MGTVGSERGLNNEMKAFNLRVPLIELGVILTPILEKGGTDPSPGNPHLKFYQRMLRVFEAALKQPSMPIAVAETSSNAIETDNKNAAFSRPRRDSSNER